MVVVFSWAGVCSVLCIYVQSCFHLLGTGSSATFGCGLVFLCWFADGSRVSITGMEFPFGYSLLTNIANLQRLVGGLRGL